MIFCRPDSRIRQAVPLFEALAAVIPARQAARLEKTRAPHSE
jgi:hypothetical protein